MAATLFETFFETMAETAAVWTELAFPWSDLGRVERADASDLSQLDPKQTVGHKFGLGLNARNTTVLKNPAAYLP